MTMAQLIAACNAAQPGSAHEPTNHTAALKAVDKATATAKVAYTPKAHKGDNRRDYKAARREKHTTW